jgi:hypothetical protein
MSITVRISDEIYEAAARTAKAEYRSTAQQIEYWAALGKAALENPDLPIVLVRDILMARAQDNAQVEPFVPEGGGGQDKGK